MEIGPIPGIRAIGAVRAQRTDWQPPAIFDIDGAARPGDGVVQRTGREAAGAEEGEDEEPMTEDESEAGGEAAEKKVDYFA
jgi:hypothetical protein